MNYVWWEKTVEYLFIKEYIPWGTLFAPLDGKHELASDGILFNKNKWVLIEFKAKYEDVSSEKRKFKNYDECMQKLMSRCNHHYFVFGEINKDEKLELIGCKYFGDSKLKNVSYFLDYGVSPTEFANYLVDLIECKKKASDLKQSIDYSTVLGISENGKVINCLTVNDYLNRVEEEYKEIIKTSEVEGDIVNAQQCLSSIKVNQESSNVNGVIFRR